METLFGNKDTHSPAWLDEDRRFYREHPTVYRSLAQQVGYRRIEREQFAADAARVLSLLLSEQFPAVEVSGRPKHLWSIWNKMLRKGITFESILDIRALRVLVDTTDECYATLRVVHASWNPIPEGLDDYIAHPKPNGYRSLHTAAIWGDGKPLEIQIRTRDMHRQAEGGSCAHWRYKLRTTASAFFCPIAGQSSA